MGEQLCSVCITESQNGSVRRDHSGIISSSRVIPELVAQDCVQTFWNIPSEEDSTASLVSVLPLGHCTVKNLFLISTWNFLCTFLPVPLALSLGTSEQSLVHEHKPRRPQPAEESHPAASPA